ncbi:hypothetical protein [Delftia sp. JD2]|uniref:hypothetical protein n=1 Tax=Delftia sp. JD2 TaxID=469553 RepID=UPI001111E12E|nr:hypothetical protein [Delftia sp. JD2]
MTYSILFIDEEQAAHRSFKRDFLDVNKERFTGTYIFPPPTLEEMMEKIFEANPDVVLTDFSLNDKKSDLPSVYTVEFNGGDIARELLSRRKNFPVFIATSLGDDAARDGHDVKLIYEKYGSFKESRSGDQSPPDAQHLTFSDKVYYEVLAHKQFIEAASAEFDAIIDKRRSEELSLKEETRLIELDSILESYIDMKSKMPDELRVTSNIKRLDALITKAEEILKMKRGQP